MAPNSIQGNRLYTIQEATQQLAISRAQLYRLIDCCEIESVKIGRSRRISAKQLESYIERLEVAAQHRTSCIVDAAFSKRKGFPY